MTKKSASNYADRPELHGIIHEENFNFLTDINKQTVEHLGKEWAGNVKHNKRFWKKHQPLMSCIGLAKGKCVIGIGASPSFHKNKDVLKKYVNEDGVLPWEQRNFVTIAANHQYKPLLKMGVIPDFVLLVDASDVVIDQLTKDIPPEGQHTTLITGVHCSPKVIRAWSKQGRGIAFYTTPAPDVQKSFRKHIKRNPKNYSIELGGNVVNGAFMIGTRIFHSSIFMCVGNDLSFPIGTDVDEQRSKYYADGDYSTNAKDTGTGRDEASSPKRWGSFRMERRRIVDPFKPLRGMNRYNFEIGLAGTSHTLWVYKNWLEAVLLGQTTQPIELAYFNCTEGGILGVMAKKLDKESMRKTENWYLLDQVCINKHTGRGLYHTAMLEDAIDVYLKAKRGEQWASSNHAPNVNALGDTSMVLHR